MRSGCFIQFENVALISSLQSVEQQSAEYTLSSQVWR